MPIRRVSRRSASEGVEFTSDCKGVLFMHELVGALSPFSGKVAIDEMVPFKALMDSTVGVIEDGEGGAR